MNGEVAAIISEAFLANESTWEERPDFAKYFKDAGVDGAFLLYDLKNDKYLSYNAKRLQQGYIPASTYKIFNSLVALETGVIRDENEILKWDGVVRLVRLYQNKLPFSQRAIDIVKDILIFETGDDYILRAKTGWAKQVGWFVGYVERKDNVYFFANNIDIMKSGDDKARIAITKNILIGLGLIAE